MEDRKKDGWGGSKGRVGWSRRVNLSRPLATLSRRAILRITSAASGQEMKIAPTLFNLDKSICYTTNSVAGWYILEEATLCLSLDAIWVRVHDWSGDVLFSLTCPCCTRTLILRWCIKLYNISTHLRECIHARVRSHIYTRARAHVIDLRWLYTSTIIR